MSGTGAPETVVPDGSAIRTAIVAAQWHDEVMNGLIAGAEKLCREAGSQYTVIRVPGAFELPVVCAHMVHNYDAVVALGVVIRGGTPHFDYVCDAATRGLTEVSVKSGVPIGFGLLTCDTEQQALDRAGLPGSSEDKGREAAAAAIETAVTLSTLRSADSSTALGFGR